MYTKEIIEGNLVYYAEFLYGLLTIITIGVSLFLTFRWGATILWAQDDTRKRLLGPVFFDLVAHSDDLLLWFVSIYLGFKFAQALLSLARWRKYMEFEKFRLVTFWARKRDTYRKKQKRLERIRKKEEKQRKENDSDS